MCFWCWALFVCVGDDLVPWLGWGFGGGLLFCLWVGLSGFALIMIAVCTLLLIVLVAFDFRVIITLCYFGLGWCFLVGFVVCICGRFLFWWGLGLCEFCVSLGVLFVVFWGCGFGCFLDFAAVL